MSEISLMQQFVTRFSGGFVLALHEIQPEKLAEFLDSLRPAQTVPLDELVDRSREGKRTSGLYAITVDDGVGENVRALARLFLSKSIPATFYLPTQYLDTQVALGFQWWRELKPLLPRRRIELSSGVIDLSHRNAIEQLSRRMEQLWHSGHQNSYLPLTMELARIVEHEQLGTKIALRPALPITWAEVALMSRNDLIRFESHGVSHTAMSCLSDEELKFEMQHSRDRISEHTGRPCRHLAYPFGSPQSIGVRAVAAAQLFYDSATTMSLGRVDYANPWLLPRVPLYPENSRGFARLKILLKCGLLCPANLNGKEISVDPVTIPANLGGD